MRLLVLPALAAGLLVSTASLAPSVAAPAGTMPVAAPESALDTVAYRKKRMKKRRMYRGSAARYRPSQAGNAKDPQRPVYQQQQGNTTGGPSR